MDRYESIFGDGAEAAVADIKEAQPVMLSGNTDMEYEKRMMIPGCERYNAKYFSGYGMSVWAQSTDEMICLAEELLEKDDVGAKEKQGILLL